MMEKITGSSQIIAQYYELIRLGYEGYRNVMQNCHDNAMVLKEGVEKTGRFRIVSKDMGVPVVAFSLKDRSRHDEFKVSEMLRRFGWIVPAYPMPEGAKHVLVLRVVIREDFSRTLADRLVVDIVKVMGELDSSVPIPPIPKKSEKMVRLENGQKKRSGKKTGEVTTKREIGAYWGNITTGTKIKLAANLGGPSVNVIA